MDIDVLFKVLEKGIEAGLGNLAFLSLFLWVALIKPLKSQVCNISKGIRDYVEVQKKAVANMERLERCMEALVSSLERRAGTERRQTMSIFDGLFRGSQGV